MPKQSQNIQLDHPRLLHTESSPVRRWSFYAMLSALGGLGAWGCFITAFALPLNPVPLILLGLFCCGFTVWRQVDPRKRWWSVSLAAWVFWLLMGVFFFDQFLHGAQRTLNAMLDQYSAKLNYDLPTFFLNYPSSVPRPRPEEEYTVFFCMLFYPFFWAMSRLLARRRSTLGAFCLSGMLLVFPLSFSILPAGWTFGTLVLFWCSLLMMNSILGGRPGPLGRRERYRASGAAAARPVTLLLVPLVLAAMLGVYVFCPPETAVRPRLVNDLRGLVEEGFGARSYLRGGQGNSNREVHLNTMGGREYTGETVLRVKFDWQGLDGAVQYPYDYSIGSYLEQHPKEYLKSFVGSVYTGSSWERLGEEARGELEQLGLRAQNQAAQNRELLYLEGVDAPVSYELSVQNLGANPRCVFTPCGLADEPEQLMRYSLTMVDDGFVKSENFFSGVREYTVNAWGPPTGTNYFSRVAERILGDPQFQIGRADWGNFGLGQYGFVDSLADGTNDWMRILGVAEVPQQWQVLRESLEGQFQAGGAGWVEDLWKAPEEIRAQLEPQALSFLDSVEAYNDFVYRNYTQVPESLREYLISYRQALGLNPYTEEERFDRRDGPVFFAYHIASVFSQYYTYSLSPPTPEAGEDFVGFFLDQSQEGYCVHFASAAVMLLRSAGYPARYAEGYAVPCTQSGWVDVPDYNAHAWVEVYCGGVGWVPVEVTPASRDNPAVYYNAMLPDGSEGSEGRPQEPAATLPPRDRRPLDLTEAEDSSPLPQGGASPAPDHSGAVSDSTGGGESFWLAAGGCAVLLAAGAGIWLNRCLRRRIRAKALAQPDRNQAALYAYALLLELYQWEALCGRREEQPPRWKELAEKARFGRGMLAPEELRELTGNIEPLQEKLRTRLSRWQKLRCWLTGLI